MTRYYLMCEKHGMKISCDNLRINVFKVLTSDPCFVECFFNTVSEFSCLCVSLSLVIFSVSCFTLSVSISLVCCLGFTSCLLITLIMFSCFSFPSCPHLASYLLLTLCCAVSCTSSCVFLFFLLSAFSFCYFASHTLFVSHNVIWQHKFQWSVQYLKSKWWTMFPKSVKLQFYLL